MISQKLILRLKNAYNVTVLTGAGISAESGVPTFRGKDGLWNNYQVQQLATVEKFEQEPELFWEFYSWRRDLLSRVKPNLGHYALVDMENYFEEFYLITQNVDNLHREAGSEHLVELHGNIVRNKCSQCTDVTAGTAVPKGTVPQCAKCGGNLRPDVVLFGEALDEGVLRKAQETSATCEVFFSVGTSSLVEPAASLPYIAKGNGAYVVEINTEPTALTDHVDEFIQMPASKVLTGLVVYLDRIR